MTDIFDAIDNADVKHILEIITSNSETLTQIRQGTRQSPLDFAIRIMYDSRKVDIEKYYVMVSIVEALIENGAKSGHKSENVDFVIAAKLGNAGICRCFLEKKSGLNIQHAKQQAQDAGHTALAKALTEGVTSEAWKVAGIEEKTKKEHAAVSKNKVKVSLEKMNQYNKPLQSAELIGEFSSVLTSINSTALSVSEPESTLYQQTTYCN